MKIKPGNLSYSILFSGLGIFSYLLLVKYSDLPQRVIDVVSSAGAFVFFIIAFNILGYSTLRLSKWVNNQYALNMRRQWKIIAVYGSVMLMLLLLNYGLLVAAKLFAGVLHPFTFSSGGFRLLMVVWLVELVILGLLLVNRTMRNTLELQQKAAELQRENNTARYAALQNQLNPHFLFNSMNTLIAEIEYDPQNAVAFTRKLSDVYRYVLKNQDKPLVTLSEELEFAKAYLFLHDVRLGHCIGWNLNIPPDCMESLLPPLTLQLLVENVIKHNTIAVSRPMSVDIFVEGEYLVVSNPIVPKKNDDHTGVGLQNLSNRCKLILDKEIVIENTGMRFTVKVPLLYE